MSLKYWLYTCEDCHRVYCGLRCDDLKGKCPDCGGELILVDCDE